ncbi:MAG: hypothetical protein LBS89_01685 [Zoogloeaceae bacterium]|jgi:tetratricopeptide (TPR) repeat protein|nr:hypothetical protein [Zoogloeaceae bacterium]
MKIARFLLLSLGLWALLPFRAWAADDEAQIQESLIDELLAKSEVVWQQEGTQAAFDFFDEVYQRLGKKNSRVQDKIVEKIYRKMLFVYSVNNEGKVIEEPTELFRNLSVECRSEATQCNEKIRDFRIQTLQTLCNEAELHFGKIKGAERFLALAYNSKGNFLQILGEFDAAIEIYDDLEQRFEKDAYIVAFSLTRKEELLTARGEYNLAIFYYNEIEHRFRNSDEVVIQDIIRRAARGAIHALDKKSWGLQKQGDFKAAAVVYETMLQRFGGLEGFDVVLRLIIQAEKLEKQSQFESARAIYDMIEHHVGKGNPFSNVRAAAKARLSRETLNNPVRPELVEGHYLQKQALRQAQPERLGVV